ncbi:TonB-dependent receptor domain-containing protein [Sphingomonas adhaesiva]|uniref:TonB-dependent receptor domain-containing protein n=1 Tax=Sphingomonas adhaesiva TaxID=28212 RepID=UPI002FF94EED
MTNAFRGRLLASTLLVASAAWALPAAAQVASGPAADAAPQQSGDDIVVTGSRIARPDLEQASPIAVVSAEEFRQRGAVNVENVLNTLPQVTGSTSGTDNNPGGGVATVNLRNLGVQRTLVLVDGRRYVAYDTNQVVDLNTIPSALIQRVDVVTGGRSAVYGSDAIAGVVNFVTRRDFSGAEVQANYGLSRRGDSAYYDLNATIGGNFEDGRGNIVAHVGYLNRSPTFAGARSFAENALVDNQDGTASFGGSGQVPQGRIGLGGTNYNFGSDGSIRPYVGTRDAYNYAPINYLQVPQERFLAYTRGTYEVSDAFKPYVEAQFINNRVTGVLAPTPISNSTPYQGGSLGPLRLQVNSPFFNTATQNFLRGFDTDGDGYVSTSTYGFRTTSIGGRTQQDNRNAYRAVLGANGDLGSGWAYDAYYMYARTENTQRQGGNVNLTNFLNSITTAYRDPATGALSAFPVANGTLVCANGSSTCVPSNFFGIGNLSTASGNYLALSATNVEEYSTQVASAAITNSSLFDLGAGGVGIALGVEHRKESGQTFPDQNLASGNVAGFNPGAPTGGSYNLTEFFGETNVPLLADKPLVHRLELNAAARYSMYSNAVNNVFTWAAGGLYEPFRGLGVRGQYQRAIRGPSVYELFLGQTVSFDGANDPCATAAAAQAGALRDRCVAGGVPVARLGDASLADSDFVNPPTTIGGNPNLREERATTWTAGVVITNPIPRFTATVDYYNIKIDGYISRLGQANLFQACYNQGLAEYCSAFGRNSAGEVDRIVDTNLNSGGLKTEGVDVSAGYTVPFSFQGEEASIGFTFSGSYLIKNDLTPIVGVPLVNSCAGRFGNTCGQPTPNWKHFFRTSFDLGQIGVSAAWRHIGPARDDDDSTRFFLERAPAQNYIDLAFTAEPTDRLVLTFGVNNLFDKKPPLSASSQNGGNGEQSNTYPNVYDVLGTYLFTSARVRF